MIKETNMPISVDLTQLSGYSSLTAGTTYSITAVAQGTGDYTSSNKSAASSYQMPQSMPVKGDIINIDMTGSGIPQQYRVLKINGNIAELFSMSDSISNDGPGLLIAGLVFQILGSSNEFFQLGAPLLQVLQCCLKEQMEQS